MKDSLLKLLQRLPELDALLRAADFAVSPDRWQSVYDLVWQLEARGRLPRDQERFARLIAPLFCNNQVEQQHFYPLFRRWAGADFGIAEVTEAVLQPSVQAGAEQRKYRRETRRWPWALATLAMVLLAAWLIYLATRPPAAVVVGPADAPKTLETLAEQERGVVTEAPPAGALELQAIPPRRPAEPVTPDAAAQSASAFVYFLLLSLPAILWLAWLLRRWWRRRVVLRFHCGRQDDPLLYLKLRHSNKTLPFGWGEFSARLKRGGSIATRKLDVDKTVDRTIHKAGLFTPVMLTRDPQPAYLVLMNRANRFDHLADRAQALFERLKEAGVTVYRLEYYDQPRVCYSTSRTRKSYTLGQLARQYGDCRLIVIGDGDGLINPFSGELQPWAQLFDAWQTRVLLTPAAWPWRAREAQLAHAGFAVAPFQVNGLEAVSDWLLKPRLDTAVWFAPGAEEPFPELFALDGDAWLASTPPPDYDAELTCSTLRAYLGQSGYRLLVACAVYPRLVSTLTLTLDQVLFAGDSGAERERRLVRLSRLPWFRDGRLPDYLRRDLLARVAEPVLERINEVYREVFERIGEAGAAGGGSLPFITRAGGVRTYLRDLVRFAPPDSPLADNLFADVLLGGRRGALEFVLPKGLARWLPGKRYRFWPALGATLAAGLAALAIHYGWQWSAPAREALMLERMKLANADITVGIATRADTGVLGDALQQALAARGFSLGPRRYVPPPGDVTALAQADRVELVRGALEAQSLAAEITAAVVSLEPELDRILQSTLRTTAGVDGARLAREINGEVAVLTDGLLASLSGPQVDLGDRGRVVDEGQTALAIWFAEVDRAVRRALAGLRGASDKMREIVQTKKLDAIRNKVEEVVPTSDEIDNLARDISLTLRKNLPILLDEALGAFATRVTEDYKRALPAALARAGESGLAVPDAIVYSPGYESAAQTIAARLAYLSYGRGNYALIRDDGTLLEAGASPLQIAVNLSRPIAAGGVFRDRLAQGDLSWTPGAEFSDDLRDGGRGPAMVVIPAGTFVMGSPDSEADRKRDEGPQREVRIQAFALGKTEVSFDDYDRFAAATGRVLPSDEGWGRGDRPVIRVSWNDAVAYADWLSRQTGEEYRLPTEAEWEYAARAGTTTRYSWGDDINCTRARYGGSSCESNSTSLVGSYIANPFGLYDMHGNVYEWTRDCLHDNYAGAPADGSAWTDANGGDCSGRVVRGGGWDGSGDDLRSASRVRFFTDVALDYLGFRLARAP